MKKIFNSTFKIAVIFFLLAGICAGVFAPFAEAVPAAPGVHTHEQQDGTIVHFQLHGDEFLSYMTDEDGDLVAFGPDGDIYLARWSEEGESDSSDTVPTRVRPTGRRRGSRTPDLENMRRPRTSIPRRHLERARKAREERDRGWMEQFETPSGTEPITGAAIAPMSALSATDGTIERNVVMIYVSFANNGGVPSMQGLARPSSQTLYNRMFGDSFGSVAHYYRTVTDDTVTIKPATTIGTANPGIIFVELPGPHGDWRRPRDNDPRNDLIIPALIQAANVTNPGGYINYSIFDANRDGIIQTDELSIGLIVHGYETSSLPETQRNSDNPSIWGHAWSFSLYTEPPVLPPTINDVSVRNYFAQGAYQYRSHTKSYELLTIGIIAHELGHTGFGFIDLYDTAEDNRGYKGLGYWSLMAHGSWGGGDGDGEGSGDGSVPTALDAYSLHGARFSPQLIAPKPVTSGLNTLNNTLTGLTQYVKLETDDPNQFFLVQPRGNFGYDSAIWSMSGVTYPNSGLLFLLVDDNLSENSLANNSHYRVAVVPSWWPAQTEYFLGSNGGRGSPHDLFTIPPNQSFINDMSTPSTRIYAGTSDRYPTVETAWSVDSIESFITGGTNVSARFTIRMFPSGSGTQADPYIIKTPAQLDRVRYNLSAHFKLGNDINLTPYLAFGGAGRAKWGTRGWEPIGNSLSSFTGSFDGNGHKITGLWIDRSDTNYVGLFRQTINSAIRNIGVEIAAAGVSGNSWVGGLVGYSYRDSITNCYTTGNVSGSDFVGGLIGSASNVTITNCYTTGNISGGTVGGLVGFQSSDCVIENSYTTGNVSGSTAGGLVGVQIGDIENSYATGNVTGSGSFTTVGGLVGSQSGDIENSYATGNVSGSGTAGGLVGAQRGDIENSYATGNVTGDDFSNLVGGLVGSQSGDIENSYATGNVSGDLCIGGLVGGQIGDCSVKNSYATGNVSGRYGIGGLVGGQISGIITIVNSYTTGNVSGNDDMGGLVGFQSRDSIIENSYRYEFATVNGVVIQGDDTVTASELMNKATYIGNGWQFSDIGPWYWNDDEKFPKLNIGTEKFPFLLITTHPQYQGVVSGENATFIVAAIGTQPLSYQWQKLNGSSWNNITGATAATYSFTTQSSDNGALFRAIVSDGRRNITSTAATLTVISINTTIITIPQVNNQIPNTGTVSNPAPAAQNTIVNLPAVTARAGFSFREWRVTSGDVIINNPTSATNASFIMGSANVTIEAIFAPATLTFNDQTLPNGTYNTAYSASVAVATGGSGTYTYSATVPAGLTMSSVGVISGTPNAAVTEQTFIVTATDTMSGGTATATYTITISAVVPTVPQGFTAAGGDSQVTLSWNTPTGNGGSPIIRYEVSRDGVEGWTNVGLNTSYVYTGLTNSTTYNFRVRAVNVAGSGAETSTSATPQSSDVDVISISVTGAGGATTITTDGGTLQMSAVVSPADATNQTVTWSVVPNTGSAFISTSGLLTAIANGTVTVRAAANDGSGVYGQLVITISGLYEEAPKITGPVTMRLGEGYSATSTGVFTVTGAPQPTVIKTGGNDSITWNDTTKRLNIAAGLATGDYIVELKADNGVSPEATFTFTLLIIKGAGTEGDPFIITTAAQLDSVRNNLSAHYKLGNDIDLTDYLEPNGAGHAKWDAAGWEPIGTSYYQAFTGSFDGDGHVLTGLWIDRSTPDSSWGVGLFGNANDAEIKDLGVGIDVAGVKGYFYVGGLVGRRSGGSIEKCYTMGSVDVDSVNGYIGVGGLVGFQFGGNITNSYTTCNISGYERIGGLVGGHQESGSIADSYATGNVTGNPDRGTRGGLVGYSYGTLTIEDSHATGNVSGSGGIGGLIGHSEIDVNIENSYATGKVTGEGGGVGGLVGNTYGTVTIESSHATGDVTGNVTYSDSEGVGGLVGFTFGGIGAIANSHATGDVKGSGKSLGGLVGQLGRDSSSSGSSIENCYATGNVTADGSGDSQSVGGLVGRSVGTIANSYATGIVNGSSGLGGLAGSASTIENSFATGNVRGTTSWLIGGLAGNATTIANSYATGNVEGGDSSDSSISGVGGLVGILSGGPISVGSIANSYATGNVRGSTRIGGLMGTQGSYTSTASSYATGSVSGDQFVGGLVGFFGGTITNSYATGDIRGGSRVGGLMGWSDGTIANSYATGNVTGSDNEVGGLAGFQYRGSINNSFATSNVNGVQDVGALVGSRSPWVTNTMANCYRYEFATVNGVVISPDDLDSAHDKKHGGIVTVNQLLTQTTYFDNGWDFSSTGQWYWADENFPKLNLGTENFPFNFPPIITKQPQNGTAIAGTTVTLSVTAGPEPLEYHWQRLSGDTWNNIGGGNSANYSFTAQTSDNGAQFRVEVSNSYDNITSNIATLTVYTLPPTINTISLPPGVVGTTYNQTLNASGTTPIWSLNSGSLPDGLTLNPTTGVISGTPTTADTSNFTVKAENDAGSDTKPLSIIINPVPVPPTITTTSLPDGTTGKFYSQTLSADGTAPMTWLLTSGSLPDGLNLNSAGVILGTPTGVNTFNFSVMATNIAGNDTRSLTITINPAKVGEIIEGKPEYSANKDTMAAKMPGFSADDLDISGGRVVIDQSIAKEIAKNKIEMGSTDNLEVVCLPVFETDSPFGGVVAVRITVTGAQLGVRNPEDILLLKIISPSDGEFLDYSAIESGYENGKFTLLPKGGEEPFYGTINPSTEYDLVVFILDGGRYDLDGDADPNGKVIDPLVIVKNTQDSGGGNSSDYSSSGGGTGGGDGGSGGGGNNRGGGGDDSGGGGCNAAPGLLIALSALPLLFIKRRR